MMGIVPPIIVLCQPQMGENIGFVARAMANCGLSTLRLVQPRDTWPNPAAIMPSAGASHIIHGATVHPTLDQAINDCTFALATTARHRDMDKSVYDEETAAIHTHAHHGQAAFVFGGERSGLSNQDVALCHGIVHCNVNPAFSSLNLGQAVLLLSHAWWRTTHVAPLPPIHEVAPLDAVHFFLRSLEKTLEKTTFFNVQEKQPRMMRSIAALFLRANLSPQEVRTLHGMIKSLTRLESV
jgi:tRNA/rRNA methyltransferase